LANRDGSPQDDGADSVPKGTGNSGEGERVPLSEEEQRILHEMEQKLYENDRGFVNRARTPHSFASRSLRWSVAIFSVGLAVLILSFRSSLLLATFGFLVMLLASLLFERSLRQTFGTKSDGSAAGKSRPLSDELLDLGKRFRSRFFQQH
jgi:hypothetical protein